jgi:hypothetical protein
MFFVCATCKKIQTFIGKNFVNYVLVLIHKSSYQFCVRIFSQDAHLEGDGNLQTLSSPKMSILRKNHSKSDRNFCELALVSIFELNSLQSLGQSKFMIHANLFEIFESSHCIRKAYPWIFMYIELLKKP